MGWMNDGTQIICDMIILFENQNDTLSVVTVWETVRGCG